MQNTLMIRGYKFLIGLRLGVVLLLLITADLCLGYICLHGNSSFYEPMNEIGVIRWLQTYGLASPMYSAWFFILLGLLFCLVINTSLCTCDKLYHLFYAHGKGRKHSALTLFIHLMHVAMVLLLVGYLISYTSGTIHNSLTLRPGGQLNVPGTDISMKLTAMDFVPYSGKRNESYIGRFIDASVHLTFCAPGIQEDKTLSINNPVSFGGYSFFLQRFNPRKKGGMNRNEYIIMDARRDPGAFLVFLGMSAFVVGFFGYIMLRSPLRLPRSSTS